MMKDVHETEVFKLLDKKGNILNKCRTNIGQNKIELGPALEDDLKIMARSFKDPLTPKVIEAIHNGTLVPYYVKTTDRLPVYYPFIKLKKNGVPVIAVDLSNYVTVAKEDFNDSSIRVKIDLKKLYAMLTSGYLYLKLFSDNSTMLPTNLYIYLSDIWAQLFCKVLIQKVGLGTNKDRLDAFMYFAQKFFLLNICGCTETIAEEISHSQFHNRDVNPTARTIAESCASRGIEMYSDLITFCNTLFNADITGLRAMRLNGSNDGMTFEYFVRQYIMLYYAPAGLTLSSLPHFVWMVISANNFAFIFNDAVIEKCCTNTFPKIMSEFYRMNP